MYRTPNREGRRRSLLSFPPPRFFCAKIEEAHDTTTVFFPKEIHTRWRVCAMRFREIDLSNNSLTGMSGGARGHSESFYKSLFWGIEEVVLILGCVLT